VLCVSVITSSLVTLIFNSTVHICTGSCYIKRCFKPRGVLHSAHLAHSIYTGTGLSDDTLLVCNPSEASNRVDSSLMENGKPTCAKFKIRRNFAVASSVILLLFFLEIASVIQRVSGVYSEQYIWTKGKFSRCLAEISQPWSSYW
jgi:hypothetical protein